MISRVLAAIASVVVLGLSSTARADRPRVRLEYTLGPGAERCPAEQVFRDMVGPRTSSGSDPFSENAAARLVVTVTRDARGYYSRAEYRDPASEGWVEEFSLPRDCRSVIHALSGAVANRLDPPVPLSSEATPKPSPAVPSPARATSTVRTFHVQLGLDGALALWMSPADYAFEGALGAGLRWRVFSLSAEVRGSAPSGAVLPFTPPYAATAVQTPPYGYGIDVTTARLAGAIVPCLHWNLMKGPREGGPYGCAVVQAGGAFIWGKDLAWGTVPYAAGGGRIGFEMGIVRRLGARLGADFLGVVLRPALRVEGQRAWIAPPFSMTVGGGLVASFR